MSFLRNLVEGQRCEVRVFNVETLEDHLVYRTNDVLFEAPNWTATGDLILNGNGVLWRLPSDGRSEPIEIKIIGVPELNNDHVLSPDHKWVYVSAFDDWHIYKAPISGGQATRVTKERENAMHFLHGINSDESQLAYVHLQLNAEDIFTSGRIHLQDIKTGEDRVLVNGDGPEDGSEFSVDGEWIYFNSEHFTPGTAQICRARLDGTDFERLTSDQFVNWFPHQSPDGKQWVYLSYPAGTGGHPADLPVEIKLVKNENWLEPDSVVQLFGGQGTINVNSWSPDSKRFAYVCYPIG
jgi:Tol biopolymer transport system component